VRHFPNVLIKEPERLFIGVLALVLGFGALLDLTPAVESAFPEWIAAEWGVTCLIGGAAKIVGLTIAFDSPAGMTVDREQLARSLERLGALLIVVGSFTYVGAVITFSGSKGFVGMATYTLLGLFNLVRLISSSAGRALLRHSEDDDDGVL